MKTTEDDVEIIYTQTGGKDILYVEALPVHEPWSIYKYKGNK